MCSGAGRALDSAGQWGRQCPIGVAEAKKFPPRSNRGRGQSGASSGVWLWLLGPCHKGGKTHTFRRQIMANQSHTGYVLKGYLFWGVKLTYTINRQEGSLVPGAGAGSRSQNQAPEPRARAEVCHSSLKRNIPRPSGLVFQQLLADGVEGAPAALWARASVTIG